MENDSVMAVNKIVNTETKEEFSEEAVMADVEESIQNKLGIENDEQQ